MGLKQQPKCKDKTCQFCNGKYCTILKQKPDVCRSEIVSERHKIPLSELVDTFAQVPPADVKEVKHGEWITDEDGFVICSECGEEHTWDDFRPSFCDMCGARMDGGVKE